MNILNKYTVKTLCKNKTRTIVTIIGIILSVAMLTAVTTFISSIQNYMINVISSSGGDWYGAARETKSDQIAAVNADKRIESTATIQNIGYAYLERHANENKPYIFVAGIEENFTDMMPIYLVSGRMPENSGEIILSKTLRTDGKVQYAEGVTITLDLGIRERNGVKQTQNNGFLTEEDLQDGMEPETFSVKEQRTYTVVGFFERVGYENYSAPGYTAFTIADSVEAAGAAEYTYDVYVKSGDVKSIFSIMPELFSGNEVNYNMDLIRCLGASNEDNYNSVFYGLGAILMGIIMLASISLIYNAFSISVSERTKQFGLISSIGATRKQLFRSVIFEALALSLIGITLGIFAGILGIGITLACVQNLFDMMLVGAVDAGVSFSLSVSALAIVIAAIVGLITVLISAMIPARRAVRVSAIDAIRQTSDINVKARDVKTSKLTLKLFGFEGMIAKKNFKRNKKKYRATVLSLFMSILLFVTASSFCAYLTASANAIVDTYNFKLIYGLSPLGSEKNYNEVNKIYDMLSSVEGVTASNYYTENGGTLKYNIGDITEEGLKRFADASSESQPASQETVEFHTVICFINDTVYEKYLQENGFDTNMYMSTEEPTALALNFLRGYDGDKGVYYTYEPLKNKKMEATPNESFASEIAVPQIIIGGTTTEKLIGVDMYFSRMVVLMYPYSAKDIILSDKLDYSTSMFFDTADHSKTYDDMYALLEKNNIDTSNLFDYASSMETEQALVTIVNVFSYGFIILISLIAAANVFNTISTNINLRRREFAMLKSMGMAQKGFNKMMNYECLLYGLKGIIYGIPASILTTYLIYKAINNGWDTGFFIPVSSILIAVGSVFAVVFATMLYSMNKLKKENTVDALKNENL